MREARPVALGPETRLFYYNTKFQFALPDQSPTDFGGGVIAASAMPAGQLTRRVRAGFKKYPYLKHRLFDPQLYLAGLDKNIAPKTVSKLATQPWFGRHEVPEYDSKEHGSLKGYKDTFQKDLLKTWRGKAVSTDRAIERAVRDCVEYQIELGCEGVILPSPLAGVESFAYETETRWLDAGVDIVKEMRLSIPVYATVAISDATLRGVDGFQNPLLASIAGQIATRRELAGAYIVVEQSTDSGYACTARDVTTGLLVLSDDLARGAGKQVLVNYMGTFGAVMAAAGTSIWTSGYFRSQRRFRLADYEENTARAMPRYFSYAMAGDIGLEKHLPSAFAQDPGKRLFDPLNELNEPLFRALSAKKYPGSVPQWEYRTSNLAAASAHYLTVHSRLAAEIDALSLDKRLDFIRRWLRRAANIATGLAGDGMRPPYTDSTHQAVWLASLDDWASRREVL
jgi:hypothetical protein